MAYQKPTRPIDHAEHALVDGILAGHFPIGDRLPAERDLAEQLGITRPTLREAIRRLEQEGWLLVQAGKPTIVQNFWQTGGLTVLNRIIQHQGYVTTDFVSDLLKFRLLLAPSYTCEAIQQDRARIRDLLNSMPSRDDSPEAYAAFDWELQRTLTNTAQNMIYPLIMNGFIGFYEPLARLYFQAPEARAASHEYYRQLLDATEDASGTTAQTITQRVMEMSVHYWHRASQNLQRIPLNNPEERSQ